MSSPASSAADTLLPDDVLGRNPAGGQPVRDRTLSAAAERLLDEWFSALPGSIDAATDDGAGEYGPPDLDEAAPAAADDPAPDPSVAAGGPAPDPSAAAGDPAPDPSAAVWSAPLRALVRGVAAVRAQPAAELPGPQAVAEAQVLLQQLETLRSVVLTRIADVDTRDLHTLADAPSTGSWLGAQQTSLTRTDVAFARRLASFPPLAAAVEHGRLSVTGAARVAAALVTARPHLDRPDTLIDGQPGEPTITAVIVDGVLTAVGQAHAGLADTDPLLTELLTQLTAIAGRPSNQLDRLTDALLLLATHVEAGQLPGALALLLDALLPDQLEHRAARTSDNRGLRLHRKHDGSGWLITRGELDLECGELLQTVLNTERAVDPDTPTDTAAWTATRTHGHADDGHADVHADDVHADVHADDVHADDGDDRPRPRSLDQQRHDALRNGLRRYLDSGIAGLRDKIAPHLSVTVGLDSLHATPGSLPAVAASGTRLPRSLTRRWLCDSAITRFVLSLGGKVLAVSHISRTLTATERRAKRLETGGCCQVAGCTRGPGCRLIPHHPTPYASCGTTSLQDTVLLCDADHHQLHHEHTVLRLKDGRRLGPHGWLPPDQPPDPPPPDPR